MKVSYDFQGRNESHCTNSANHNKDLTGSIYGFYCSIFMFTAITHGCYLMTEPFCFLHYCPKQIVADRTPGYKSEQLALNLGSVNQ